MRIRVYTQFGEFASKTEEATPAEVTKTKEFLTSLASDGSRLSFESPDGFVIFAADALKSSVILLEA